MKKKEDVKTQPAPSANTQPAESQAKNKSVVEKPKAEEIAAKPLKKVESQKTEVEKKVV